MVALAAAAPSSAAPRYAAPSGTTGAAGTCLAALPCSLNRALGGARAGDEIIVAPGAYTVGAALKASVPVDLHGVDGQPRPALVASGSLDADTLSLNAGGSVRHLELTNAHDKRAALDLRGGLGSDLLLRAKSDAVGARLHGAPGGTLLRDTVAHATGPGSVAVEVAKDGAAGTAVKLLNVTAFAASVDSTAIHNALEGGALVVSNTIARGGVRDIEGESKTSTLVSRSNFRAAASDRVTGRGGNSGRAPLFVDSSAGDFHERAGSPTIDAGDIDPQSRGRDADGTPRPSGPAPDVGAYEAPPGTLAAPPPPDNPAPLGAGPGGSLPPAPPRAGRTVVVRPVRGTIRVRRPGAKRSVSLESGTPVPTGSVLDATRGAVQLSSAKDLHGTTQTAVFSGARFTVRQLRTGKPRTDIVLRGGDFSRCRTRAPGRRSVVAAGLPGRVVRSLWGRDRRGRFTTRGSYGSASVRGTEWLTEDRCDGTRVYVRHGAVSVHDDARHRDVLVRAGHAHLVRRPRRK